MSLSQCFRFLAFLGTVLLAGSALAVGNLQVDTVGANAGEATLVLESPQGGPVKQDEDGMAGQISFRNLDAGTYKLRTLVNGQQIGEAQTISIQDNETARYKVDTSTGIATAVAAAMLGWPQQQQSMFWLGFGLGYADDNGDGSFTSIFGNGNGGLNSSGAKGGIEFQIAPPMPAHYLGSWYAYGRLYSMGIDDKGFFVDAHPTPGRDSGVKQKFDYEGVVGLGWRFPVAQQFGLAVFAGIAMTRMKTTVFSDETGGGGPYNKATSSKTSYGANWGVEGSYRLRWPQRRNTELFLRAEQIRYRSNDASVTSPFTGATYRGGIDSGHINQYTTGFRVNF